MLCLGAAMMTSCTEASNDTATLNLSFNGLENLGADYAYEGWVIVDGEPITTGVFTVNDAGQLSANSFEIAAETLENASTFVLTIEPSPDSDPMPSATHVVAGDFSSDAASLTVGHDAALATDFNDAAGKYIVATPTDGNGDIDEESGIWFLDNSSGSPVAGLELPELPSGWIYEGWVVFNGTPVSTGTFRTATESDGLSIYSGTAGGPPFPGEDFLTNAPAGLTFPTSVLGNTVVISVEPFPDNSSNPFALKPLASMISGSLATHSVADISNNASATNISGTATK